MYMTASTTLWVAVRWYGNHIKSFDRCRGRWAASCWPLLSNRVEYDPYHMIHLSFQLVEYKLAQIHNVPDSRRVLASQTHHSFHKFCKRKLITALEYESF